MDHQTQLELTPFLDVYFITVQQGCSR